MDRSVIRVLSRLGTQRMARDYPTPPTGVTIAIPNWNHEFVLPRSVGSALRAVNALRAIGVAGEVLVVDDRSRDGSLTLLRQLEALHYVDGLRILALGRNSGLPVARNTALTHATYRHIVFMDADNELASENLPLFYRAIRDTAAAAVFGNLLRQVDADESGRPGPAALVSNESVQPRIFRENYIDAFAIFDRIQVLDADGYLNAAEVEAREDWELYLHLAAMGRRIVFVPVVFGIYHALPGSMIQEADAGDDGHRAQKEYIHRVFDQLGIRAALPLTTRYLRYHPDVGYL
jgi:glycosyltransferase involved in cell wall biosynthesis